MFVEENTLQVDRVPRSVVYRFSYTLHGRTQLWASGDFREVQEHARLVVADGATDPRFEVELVFD
ncbi:unnamed protein product [marine sediment metagenome]|uniref:Uncharacterized protein n=1 Tax=marine sediment metagenome TaxID=412755 RepID=X1JDI5_9ZZZZ